ncbi:homoserine kinase [Perkinsela sp. CCAP 1560/4]|nr:homoserine kinase [Perkinsela sp. CCAP 1560/4]KNH08929.1 homoserine kinase [Perkinsela sp. CCAP 1560/4]|eukprot:KNH04295.1 homoserine kinase [Perkinsela sp. CCAP 1560/4]
MENEGKKRPKVKQVKGFGSRWVQVPIPDRPTEEKPAADASTGVFDVQRRMDTIPNLTPTALQWAWRVEAFEKIASSGKPMNLFSLTHAMKSGTTEPDPQHFTESHQKTIKMVGQYTVSDTSLQTFEWVDHDGILEKDATAFRSVHKIASIGDSDKRIGTLLKWKERIDDEEADALQTLLSVAEERENRKHKRQEATIGQD